MSSEIGNSEIPLDETLELRGVVVRYPGFWSVERTEDDEKLSVTLNSTGTTFWMLTIIPGPVDFGSVFEAAIKSYEEEYEDVDVYDRLDEEHADWIQQELELQCHDLVTKVVLNVMPLEVCSLFILYQGLDSELDNLRPLLDSITSSVRIDPQQLF
ncbi:hypothetical protein [Rubinisphaera margarita]|uniref:hypothetical protein n=1 Tax=Rubinisphaera margarita TaxID=2909586 RepID=UPI001EE8232F|nr:hypothetical protein [Rubinisphaera margarita]MCG6157660.1 hypothetical protein [Rubinisphaera margarita]